MPMAQERVMTAGREIFRLMEREKPGIFDTRRWTGELMALTMSHPELKVSLFRFIDVLPTLTTTDQVASHIREYFLEEGAQLPAMFRTLLAGLDSPLTAGAVASVVRRKLVDFSRTFIVGESPAEARKELRKIWGEGRTFTVDLLGEAALSEAEAGRYRDLYLEVAAELGRELAGWQTPHPERERHFPRLNLSVKVSSLFPRIGPMNFEESVARVCDGLRPILREVRAREGFVNVDMEMYSIKEVTLAAFTTLLEEPEFAGWDGAGIALQAYLKDTWEDIGRLSDWCRERKRHITVRLVKGAYWEYETITARQKGWPAPVYSHKSHTDWNFERCMARILDNREVMTLAVGSHNVRTLAATMVAAEERGIPREAYEFQMLYGMAEPIKRALGRMGHVVRDYAPIGELLPGMAYLVRRLLENTSNEGFLRKTFTGKADQDALLAEPAPYSGEPSPKPTHGVPPFANEAFLDFSRRANRDGVRSALARVRGEFGRAYPLVIAGEEVTTKATIVSLNPARPEEVVGEVAALTPELAERAMAAAVAAQPAWGGRPAAERAAFLFRAAEITRQRRFDLLAWQVLETGKSWNEADADVAETIDYFEYYAREALRLGEPQRLGGLPGEENHYHYQPRGVGLVIAPWNFPLAISAGMVGAALMAGNAVLYKPSSQSPVNGWQLMRILREAGVPDGVLQFIPGSGALVGERLVAHRDLAFIAFTGSREVGLDIVARAAAHQPGQRCVRKVIAEMGGKNPLIVDADADLDAAVAGALQSAFGYQGQKCSACSRVIVLAGCYERFTARLAEAVQSMTVGPPEDPASVLGPVIDAAARDKVLGYLELARQEGKVLAELAVPADGFYVPAAVVAELPADSRILREEIFGPLLAVVKAADLDEALRIANDSEYALTGGLYSRSPAAIRRVSRELAAGNLYLNRPITGAMVGRQPFGGFRLSGVGSKAGGPDYLLQFLEPRVVTENTMRRGFSPEVVA